MPINMILVMYGILCILSYDFNFVPISKISVCLSAKLSFLICHPFEVVSRYRDPQPQVGENYSYLFNVRPIVKSWYLNTYFIPNDSDLPANKTD